MRHHAFDAIAPQLFGAVERGVGFAEHGRGRLGVTGIEHRQARAERHHARWVSRVRDGEVFHLWFHPHNFGTERAKRLARLEQALEIIATSAALRGLSLRSMRELAG